MNQVGELKYSKFGMVEALKLLSSIVGNEMPNSLIYGRFYRNKYKYLIKSQNFSKEKIKDIQFEKLKIIVTTCFNRNLFYHRYYKEHGFTPECLKTISDINKIPTINKSIVKQNIELISSTSSKMYFVSGSHTGGTSSTPMYFPETIVSKVFERAFYTRFLDWHGICETDKKITFKGGYSDTSFNWLYNPLLKSIIFRLRDISEEPFKKISKIVQKIKPKAIVYSYPSLVYAYALMINQGILPKPASLENIICSSETIHSYQIKEIESAFNTTPIDSYGQNERVSLVQQCPQKEYHIIPEYGITEILDENNNHVVKEGKTGEITGTGFLNSAFPLIRYKTDDFAVLGSKQNCSCGLPFQRLKKIIGRCGDFLKTEDGTWFSAPIIEFTIDNFKNFKDIQLVQKNIKQVTVLLNPDDNYTSGDGKKVISDLTKRTHNRIEFTLKIVDHINKPKNFKKRLIVSEIDQ